MADGTDWANILNLKDEPTFEEKWASSLADIGIFPTEKIYGKDIQTPTIGMEPGDPRWSATERRSSEKWAALSAEEREEIERRNREINKRWALEREENRKRKIEEERIKREKEQYGGVTFEEYKRRIQAGWKFNPRGAVAGGGKWISPRLAAPAVGAPARKVSPEEEKYPELAAFNERVSKILRSKEFMALSELEKLPYYEKFEAQRTKITDRIEKKIKDRTKEEEDADEDVDFAELWQVIKDVNAGRSDPAELALFLRDKKVSESLYESIMEEIPSAKEAAEIGKIWEETSEMREARERKRKEDELLATLGDEYKWLGLADKDSALFQKAVQAKDQLDFDKDKNVFNETMKTLEFDYKQEQATVKHEEWVVEEQRLRDDLTIKTEQWETQFDADEVQRRVKNEQIRIEHLEDVRAAEAQEKLTGNKDLMNYTINTSKNELAWELGLHSMGLEDKEFIQSAYEFTKTFDFNKEKEETRAREFGQEYRLDVAQETAIQNRFEQSLTKEYANLNLQIEKLGLAKDVETRLAQTASLTAMMEIKKHGLAEAKQRLEGIKARKEWIFKERYWQLDSAEAEVNLFKIMSDIYNDAERLGIERAFKNASIANMQGQLEFDYYKLAQEDTPGIELSTGMGVTVSNMSPEMQGEVSRWVGTIYDEDKGFYHPKPEEWELINNFLFGKEGDPRPKERFGVNLDVDEFIRGCAGQFDFSDQMKGWCAVTRDKEFMWEKVIAAGVEKGVVEAPDIEDRTKTGWFDTGLGGALRGIGETIGGAFEKWWNWTKPAYELEAGIELAPTAIKTGDIRTDVNNIVEMRGIKTTTEVEIRQALSDMGYSYAEINALFGGE